MKSGTEARIGVFEYDWSLYSFIKDFVIQLAEAGFLIDFFQKNPGFSPTFADNNSFKDLKNVRFFEFSVDETLSNKILRKYRKIMSKFIRTYFENPLNLLDRAVLRESSKIVDSNTYCCFIGVEKKGLVWAGLFAEKLTVPLVYYSLELYIEDHPGLAGLSKTRYFSNMRTLERFYHNSAVATIIQDLPRAQVLQQYNQLTSSRFILFPISVRGPIVRKNSNLLRQNLQLQPTQKLLLYYGLIENDRFSTELVRIAPKLKDGVILVMHGYGESKYLRDLVSIADKEKTKFSLKFVPEDQIINLISSATIGLAMYQKNNSNDRLAAFSSVKVAYYMQCGIPLIAFHSESFTELIENYRCGELIQTIEEIPEKVEMILNNYDRYREQAYLAFNRYYDFDKNITSVITSLHDVIEEYKQN